MIRLIFQIIFSYVDIFNSTHSTIFLVTLLLNTFLICVTLFQVTATGSESNRVIVFIFYVTGLCAELLFFYWHGQMLTYESGQVALAVWKSDWYKRLELKGQMKNVRFLLQKAQRPVYVHVGQFFELTLDTYVTVSNKS